MVQKAGSQNPQGTRAVNGPERTRCPTAEIQLSGEIHGAEADHQKSFLQLLADPEIPTLSVLQAGIQKPDPQTGSGKHGVPLCLIGTDSGQTPSSSPLFFGVLALKDSDPRSSLLK